MDFRKILNTINEMSDEEELKSPTSKPNDHGVWDEKTGRITQRERERRAGKADGDRMTQGERKRRASAKASHEKMSTNEDDKGLTSAIGKGVMAGVKRTTNSKRKLGGFDVKPITIQDSEVDEALKLDAPQNVLSRKEVHDYMDRIKDGTKTKADRFKPIVHGSNIKALLKSDDPNDRWDLDDFAKQITTPIKQILDTNAKMAKSKKEGSITYDLTLPAISGIVVDEETGDFVEVTTCPGAGECKLICYARKGGYVMFPNSSMSAARALNFLMNHPTEYMDMFDREVKQAKKLADKNGIKLLVRIHDAGDFFSKQYYDLSMDVARNNPDTKFYFYTKIGELAADSNAPPNVVSQFSSGSKPSEVNVVKFHRNAGKKIKDAITLSKDEFRGLFVTDAKGKYVKDTEGRTQVKSPEAWKQFQQQLGSKYNIDPESVITYDQMVRIPEGTDPKWNVVVFPAGHGDLGATRRDVENQFLMFH